jgi:SAM-dependent methyltransferase
LPNPLTKILHWGRSLNDYVAMFALSVEDRSRSILGCGDGASSFNAEATAQGMRVVSVDALYDLRAEQIQLQIDATTDLAAAPRAAMQRFLADYPEGLDQGRYVTGILPNLPFMDNTYDLALYTHSLIRDGEQHDAALHLSGIQELCRVAEEVRIFPLAPLMSVETALLELGFNVTRIPVAGEFQQGANLLLRITPG